MEKQTDEKRYVVVTTSKEAGRGVFGGYLASRTNGSVVLEQGRVCVHWSRETRGFIGLAATGPMEGSRVSQAAPRLELVGVTAIAYCTPEAQGRWEAGPWN